MFSLFETAEKGGRKSVHAWCFLGPLFPWWGGGLYYIPPIATDSTYCFLSR